MVTLGFLVIDFSSTIEMTQYAMVKKNKYSSKQKTLAQSEFLIAVLCSYDMNPDSCQKNSAQDTFVQG